MTHVGFFPQYPVS